MNMRFFDEETGETIRRDFPSEYYQNVKQLAHDLKESQGGVDAEQLAVVMEINPKSPPAGWNEFVSDVLDAAA